MKRTQIYCICKIGTRASFLHSLKGEWSLESIRQYVARRVAAEDIHAIKADFFDNGALVGSLEVPH